MSWQQLLIASQLLLDILVKEELVEILLVNKFWMDHILQHLKLTPLLCDNQRKLNERTICFYHYLNSILEPDHYRFNIDTSMKWKHPYIQVLNNRTLPYDFGRMEYVLHIKQSRTRIIGTKGVNGKATTFLHGRIRIGENISGVELASLNLSNGTWGITVDNGSEVSLKDLTIQNCLGDGIMISGDGSKCTATNCIIENCGECGINIDKGACVTLISSRVSDVGSDAICVAGGSEVAIDVQSLSDKNEYSSYTSNGYDDSESKVYALRACGKGTKVKILGARRNEAHAYFKIDQNQHSPMRELRGGVITFAKKREKEKPRHCEVRLSKKKKIQAKLR
jgi:parallel beta-helix repeat protein